MPQATKKSPKSDKAKKKQSDGGDAGPSAQERAESGVKLAQHLQTAMTGGKIRQAFALWRASKQLSVAAAGTGDIVKKHPLAAALIGGGLAATVIYLTARSAGAQDESAGEDADAGEGEDDADREQAEDQASDDDAGEEEEGEDEQDEAEEDEEEEAPAQNNRNGARQRSGSRGR